MDMLVSDVGKGVNVVCVGMMGKVQRSEDYAKKHDRNPHGRLPQLESNLRRTRSCDFYSLPQNVCSRLKKCGGMLGQL